MFILALTWLVPAHATEPAALPAHATAPAALPARPVPGTLESYRDWTIGCDNGDGCAAVALLPENALPTDNRVSLSIVRRAGPAAEPTLHLAASETLKGTLGLLVDGRAMADLPVDGDDLVVTGPQATVLALAMAHGQAMEIRLNGKRLARPSLAGAAAALRYMDARQGRAGTVTALVAAGPLGAQAVKPGRPVPTVRMMPVPVKTKAADLWTDEQAAVQRISGCGERDRGNRPVEQFALSATQALMLIPCGAGAYNFTSVPLIATGMPGRRSFAPARFDYQPGWGTDAQLPALVNAGFDPARAQLKSYAKGRGLGDCGGSETYVWDGAMFRLTEATAMGECRGAWNWITTWRADVAR